MVKPELGTKRVCVACGARFYDLTRSPAICPKCGTEQPVEQPRLRRPPGGSAEDRRPKKAAAPVEEAETETVAADDETEEDVLEDTSDLEDDADAIVPEIEVPEGDETEH
jgi:uncharacterized protein (TIGR02300 family)